MYVWSKRAFGPFAGFITGWTYWSANLPYFPGLLYFAAANALFVGGPSAQALSSNSTYFLIVSFIGLAVAVGSEHRRPGHRQVDDERQRARRLGADRASASRSGSTRGRHTDRRLRSPRSRCCRAPASRTSSSGPRSRSRSAASKARRRWAMKSWTRRRTVPRAILTAAAFITIIYIVATLCVLLALPREQVSGLQGFMQAIQAMAGKAGAAWLVPVLAAMVSLNAFGAVAGWFAATARLPFVAGIDRFLPQRVCRPAPSVAYAVRRPSRSGRHRRRIRIPRTGRHVRARRVRSARQHEHHRQFHPVPLHVRGDDQVAGRAGRSRGDSGAGGTRRRADPRRRRASSSAPAPSCWRACPPTRSRIKTLAVIKVVGASVALVAIGAMIYQMGKRRT